MIVLRKTMDAALEAERAKVVELARTYGDALRQTAALQKQLADWITDKGEALAPEQFAALFWSHDNRWQAAFFNALQDAAQASFDARPPARPGKFVGYVGVPAGEGQWCWMADHIDDSGFETLEAMYQHAKHARRSCVRCGAKPVRETLDGDDLCQACCDAWVRAEGVAEKEAADASL